MTKLKMLAAVAMLALVPGFAQAKDGHQNQLNTPIPETTRTSQQPLDATKHGKGSSDPVEQHNQKPAQPVDNGNASPRPASK
jgi:hypothetical protein